MLLRHSRPDRRGLPAEYLLPKQRRPLRKSLHTVRTEMDAGRQRDQAHTETPVHPKTIATSLQVETPKPATFAIYLRIPSWTQRSNHHHQRQALRNRHRTQRLLRHQAHLAATTTASTSRYRRPSAPKPIDDLHPNTVALMRGPTMYVALNPKSGTARQRLSLRRPQTNRAPGLHRERHRLRSLQSRRKRSL